MKVTLVAPALVLLLTACGGDNGSEPDDGPTSEDTDSGALAVTDGITTADLLSCLVDAGLPAVPNDSVPLGVEAPTEGIEIKPLEPTALGSEQGADLWVFADPTAAQDHRVYITLSEEDDNKNWVSGNVVVRLFYPAEDGDPQIETIRACLPA